MIVKEIVVGLVYEKLAAACVWTCIRHSDCAFVVAVGACELIFYFGYGWVSVAGSCWVAALNHKSGYDSVEDGAVEGSFLYQFFEVASGYGHITA